MSRVQIMLGAQIICDNGFGTEIWSDCSDWSDLEYCRHCFLMQSGMTEMHDLKTDWQNMSEVNWNQLKWLISVHFSWLQKYWCCTSIALAISTTVLSHGAIRQPQGKNAEVLGESVMLNSTAFYICKRKCYMGFCTPRCTVMESKKRKKKKKQRGTTTWPRIFSEVTWWLNSG